MERYPVYSAVAFDALPNSVFDAPIVPIDVNARGYLGIFESAVEEFYIMQPVDSHGKHSVLTVINTAAGVVHVEACAVVGYCYMYYLHSATMLKAGTDILVPPRASVLCVNTVPAFEDACLRIMFTPRTKLLLSHPGLIITQEECAGRHISLRYDNHSARKIFLPAEQVIGFSRLVSERLFKIVPEGRRNTDGLVFFSSNMAQIREEQGRYFIYTSRFHTVKPWGHYNLRFNTRYSVPRWQHLDTTLAVRDIYDELRLVRIKSAHWHADKDLYVSIVNQQCVPVTVPPETRLAEIVALRRVNKSRVALTSAVTFKPHRCDAEPYMWVPTNYCAVDVTDGALCLELEDRMNNDSSAMLYCDGGITPPYKWLAAAEVCDMYEGFAVPFLKANQKVLLIRMQFYSHCELVERNQPLAYAILRYVNMLTIPHLTIAPLVSTYALQENLQLHARLKPGGPYLLRAPLVPPLGAAPHLVEACGQDHRAEASQTSAAPHVVEACSQAAHRAESSAAPHVVEACSQAAHRTEACGQGDRAEAPHRTNAGEAAGPSRAAGRTDPKEVGTQTEPVRERRYECAGGVS